MRRLAALVAALEATPRAAGKAAALAAYLASAPETDRVWTLALLAGRRPRRVETAARLAEWAAAAAGLPDWLMAESLAVVGDLAETAALVLPPPASARDPGLAAWMERLAALAAMDAAARRAAILDAWAGLDSDGRFLLNRLLTGGFRTGVGRGVMARALAQATGRAEATLAHALMGGWDPARTTYAALVAGDDGAALGPYPFGLARPLDRPVAALGAAGDWLAEWAWDGLRIQIVARGGALALWSRDGELLTDRLPEFAPLAAALAPGSVIDGEVLAWPGADPTPLPPAALAARLGRTRPTRQRRAAAPAVLRASDLLEAGGVDLRARPLEERRSRLAALLAGLPGGGPVQLSPELVFADWAALAVRLAGARAAGAGGAILKRRAAPYPADGRCGDWWRWPLAPMTIDAVLVYAEAGQRRGASPEAACYTFAVHDGGALVPVARAREGLTDGEFARIAAWARENTLERFGPVRRLRPELVFEIGFEGVDASPRHKAGLVLRQPRMLRWRLDGTVAGIATLAGLRALMRGARGP